MQSRFSRNTFLRSTTSGMLWLTLRQLKSKNSDTRLRAVRVLGEQGGSAALKALVTVLLDPDMAIPQAALQALDRVNPEWPGTDPAQAILPAAIAFLASPNPDDR